MSTKSKCTDFSLPKLLSHNFLRQKSCSYTFALLFSHITFHQQILSILPLEQIVNLTTFYHFYYPHLDLRHHLMPGLLLLSSD